MHSRGFVRCIILLQKVSTLCPCSASHNLSPSLDYFLHQILHQTSLEQAYSCVYGLCSIENIKHNCNVLGLSPAYGRDEFVQLKVVPKALMAARSSVSLTLTCSATGSPTPHTAWYKEGRRVAGTQVRYELR